MKVEGRHCRMVIVFENTRLTIPFLTETLRAEPLIEHREPLLGDRRPGGAYYRGEKITGCFTCRITKSTAPLLLYLALGKQTDPQHVPETRSLFFRDLSIQDAPDSLPEFTIILDRDVERTEYLCCRATGFELRGEIDEPLVLRLDITGEERQQVPQTTPLEEALYEEPLEFHNKDIQLNGEDDPYVYGFSLTLRENPEQGNTEAFFTLNAALDETLGHLAERTVHTADASFRTRDDEYEANRKAGFDIHLEGLILRKDQKGTSSATEILSPYIFSCHGPVSIRIYETGERA